MPHPGTLPVQMPLPLQSPSRAHFNSSPLVRCLSGLGVGVGPDASGDPQPTVAEQLSSWLDWTDAQALFTELQGKPVAPATPARPGAPERLQRVTDELHRVRAELARGITTDTVFTDTTADASTCQRHHLAHQRTMDARLAPLRATLRAELAAHSPGLGRLAALDALLDRALDARESHLLARVPALLAQRTERARPASGSIPPEERQSMLAALLAELDTRMQPIEGLLEALAHSTAATNAP